MTPRIPLSMEFSRQEYWSGCHFLLQGIFPTRGSNTGLLHCRQVLYWLNYQGSPKIILIEWVSAWLITWVSECQTVTPWTTPSRLFCSWNSPVRNTGLGSLSLLQGIFPTQGLNPGLLRLHHRPIVYHWATWEAHIFDKKLVFKICKEHLQTKTKKKEREKREKKRLNRRFTHTQKYPNGQ